MDVTDVCQGLQCIYLYIISLHCISTYVHPHTHIYIHTRAYRYLSPGAGAASARRLLRPSASSAPPLCWRTAFGVYGIVSASGARAEEEKGRRRAGLGWPGARAARGWARWAKRRPVELERHVAGTHPINAASERAGRQAGARARGQSVRITKSRCSPGRGRMWVAHFVWAADQTHGPPHTKWAPRQREPDRRTFARTMVARLRSVDSCGRRVPRHLWWRVSARPTLLPCQAGSLSVTGGVQVPLVGASLQERGQSPTPAVDSSPERPSVLRGRA